MDRLGIFIDIYVDIPEEWWRELINLPPDCEDEHIADALATTAKVIVVDEELIKKIQNPELREYLSKLYCEKFEAPFIIAVI